MFQGERMYLASGLAPSTLHLHQITTHLAGYGFCHNAAATIMGAKEEQFHGCVFIVN